MYTKPMVELAVFLLYSQFRAQISAKGLKIHRGIPSLQVNTWIILGHKSIL